MCERTEFLPIGTHVNLILNRLRLQRALLELEEPAPAEQSELSERAAEHRGAAVIGSGLTIQHEGANELKAQANGYDPLRNAHLNPPQCVQNFEGDDSKREQTTEQTEKPKRDPKEECEYIKERLRQIAKFEQRYKGKT